MDTTHNGHPEPTPEVAGQAQRMLKAAATYVQQALRYPDEADGLRRIVALQLLEVALLRDDIEQLKARIARLEGRQ